MDLRNIGVVIPAYNAEKTIGSLIEELLAYGFDKENIIVVDDGSKDHTCDVAIGAGVSVVCHENNRGKGAALKTGFDVARTRNLAAVVTLDADGQHRVSELDGFLKLKNDYDLIIGARRYNYSRMSFPRKMTNKTTSLVISLLGKKYVPDVQCGFRLINLDIFNNVNLKTKNFQTEPELVVKAVRNRYKVGSVPITTIYNSGRSYIRPLIDTVRFIDMAVRLLWR